MIDRYCREEMKNIWELESKFQAYLDVEIAVCEVYKNKGVIPEKDYQKIKRNAKFDIKQIEEIEKEVNHDVIAFLTCVNQNIGSDSSRYMHMGLTSSDVIDTALGIQFKRANEIIKKDYEELLKIVKIRAYENKETICIGRSHGIHAEPMTFGVKLLTWYDMLKRSYDNFIRVREYVEVGQISGPVGTYSNIDPEIEKEVCKILKLSPARISTQVISRDRYGYYMQALAMIGSVIEYCATEIRHLQRTEVLEVEEGFKKGQKGSSAMPHKKNPISSENLCGLSRVIRSNTQAAMENIVLWHERDISHSSVERIIFPDTTILIDYVLNRFKNTVENLNIYKERMRRNTELYGGVVYSQKVLLKLVSKGLTREEAYKIVQEKAHKNFGVENGDFKKSLLEDENILKIITKEEIEDCFDIKDYLKNIDKIFEKFDKMDENLE